MTLYDCGLALLHPQAANFFLNGKRPVGTGNPHPNLVPYDKFPTRTGEIFIASGNNGQFRKLCRGDRPAASRRPIRALPTTARATTTAAALTAELKAAFADADGQEIALRLIRAGVPAGPVLWVDEATTAPHTAHREHGDGARLVPRPRHADQAVAHAGRHARGAAAVRRTRGGRAGAHGFSAEEIAALQAAGVVLSERRR